ncbi:expressed unknown protein [Seminavis robusta]|uniref:Uncharacterized protein n=1 Tax=Seminavis robusta TaxID=568900 RepID=A0A9N8HUQ4_9STRA|nr:expressed unknown protein [Seminavis robusta]|eukprot:Sro1792_g297890.1 n/a (375) ;mRNA; r:16485-17609
MPRRKTRRTIEARSAKKTTKPEANAERGSNWTARGVLRDLLLGFGIGTLIFFAFSQKMAVKRYLHTAAEYSPVAKTEITSQIPENQSTSAEQPTTKKDADAESSSQSGPSVGLTVIHCNEDWGKMNWVDQVPSHWKFVIYEACGQTMSKASKLLYSASYDECTGYLQSIIEHYDDLPDINIFLQPDALIGHGALDKTYSTERTPFKSLQELFNATMAHSSTWEGSQFLHFGPRFLQLNNVNAKEHFMDYHPREVLDTMQMPYLKNHENDNPAAVDATKVYTRIGSCFAVTRDAIRTRPVQLYKKLKTSVYLQGGGIEGRKRCCAVERFWHAIFGKPYELFPSDTVDHLWDAELNLYSGTWEEELKRQRPPPASQ